MLTIVLFLLIFSFFGTYLIYQSTHSKEITINYIFMMLTLATLVAYLNIAIFTEDNKAYLFIYELTRSELLSVDFTIYTGPVASFMVAMILTISLLAHYYSWYYMSADPHHVKFMSYLTLFTFFMILMLTASNFIVLFLGWEGIGICSYLLISFWSTRTQAVKSAIMAVLVNKIGDLTYLIATSLCFIKYSTLNIDTFNQISQTLYSENESYILYTIAILFLISTMSKSAQLGLHIWLPEAMEGPTPVSSLIHAATLVTAGIFLILRLSPVFAKLQGIMIFMMIIGALTSFFAASCALGQKDTKKVIAYSTCSQLGYMFMACGLNAFNYAIYHLITHAFFKALLFLVAGQIIHSLLDEQDSRKYPALTNTASYLELPFIVASMSLGGLPSFSGFLSKENIIEFFKTISFTNTLQTYEFVYFSHFLAYITMYMTLVYSTASIITMFFSNGNPNKNTIIAYHAQQETESNMHLKVFSPLGTLSVSAGFILNSLFSSKHLFRWRKVLNTSGKSQLSEVEAVQNIDVLSYVGNAVHGYSNLAVLFIFFFITFTESINSFFHNNATIDNAHLAISKIELYHVTLYEEFFDMFANKYPVIQRQIFQEITDLFETVKINFIPLFEKSLTEFFLININIKAITYLSSKGKKTENLFASVNIFLSIMILFIFFI